MAETTSTAVSAVRPSTAGASSTRRVASPARDAKVAHPGWKCPFVLYPSAKGATPPEGGWDGANRGTSTGLLLTHFLNELLYANYDNRWDDETLYAVVRAEYPNRATIQSFSRYRGCFNSHTYGFGLDAPLKGDEKLPRYQGAAAPVTPPKGEAKVAPPKGESIANPPVVVTQTVEVQAPQQKGAKKK